MVRGALLAVHPINIASVAWILKRENVLPMEFYLACLLAFVRGCEQPSDSEHILSLDAIARLGLGRPGQPSPSPGAAEILVAAAERACRLTQYRRPHTLLGLSKSLVAAGRPEKADKAAARASEVATAEGQTELATAIEDYRRSLGR